MNWQNKMAFLIKDTIGCEYDLEVHTMYKFAIRKEGQIVLTRETAYDISAHWAAEALASIEHIMRERYFNTFKKLNNKNDN